MIGIFLKITWFHPEHLKVYRELKVECRLSGSYQILDCKIGILWHSGCTEIRTVHGIYFVVDMFRGGWSDS